VTALTYFSPDEVISEDSDGIPLVEVNGERSIPDGTFCLDVSTFSRHKENDPPKCRLQF